MVLLAGIAVGVGDVPAPAAVPVLPAGFELVTYPTGQQPYNLTNFAWLSGGGLLTSGKDGTVTYVAPGGSPQVIAQVPGVRVTGDHGLLGFAPANDYATSGHVFITYDKGDALTTGYGMVEEWTAAPPDAPTSFTYTKTLIDGSTTSPPLLEEDAIHSIDTVVVAPDDTLYVSIGDDALNNGSPKTLRAQDLDQPYGKLLHLSAGGAGLATNPFYDSAHPRSWRSMVFAYGFRNPFRFDLDPRSGVVHLGDVGWRTTEEVDTVPRGANAGWPCYEGTAKTTFASYAVCASLYAAGSALMPIVTYPHAGTGASVIGGMHYTGTTYPESYADAFFYGDYTRQEIWTLATDAAGRLTRGPETPDFAHDAGAPVAFHPGPNGDVTFADLLTGNVVRLVYTSGNRPPVAVASASTDAATRTVNFSGDASYDLDGDELTYAWDFGDGNTATGVSAMHTYEDSDPEQVTLTVTDSLGAIGTATLTVYPANYTPQVALTAPVGHTYAVGEPVELSATATDAEDGPLSITWTTLLLHCPFAGSCHVHPEGDTSGMTYSEPFTDHGSDTTMLITAHATDSLGATASETYEAKPTLRTVAVNSPVAVAINGEAVAFTEAVVGSQVEVVAPVTSSYRHFVSWSDKGAAAHAFTMPDADVTLSAVYDTDIDRKYAALGGAQSTLGAPKGVEYDIAGGRARNYTGGRIYWSAATGAHEVHGPILTRLLTLGGPSYVGFPTSDSTVVAGNGRLVVFSRGRIYWSSATGAWWSHGHILGKYLALGGPAKFGLPINDVNAMAGGQFEHFTGSRSIFWSANTMNHMVTGRIRARYASLGYARSCLGFPTTDPYPVRNGWRSNFEHGSITYITGKPTATATC